MVVLVANLLLFALGTVSLIAVWRKQTGGSGLVKPATLSLLALLLVGLLCATLVFPGDPFGMMQMAAWGLFLHLPLYLIGLAALSGRRHWRAAIVCLTMAGGIWTVAVDAFFVEPQWLEVSTVKMSSSKVQAPLRIVLIADLQTDRPGEYEAEVLAAAVAGNPDLILFAGDYVQQTGNNYLATVEKLRDLLLKVELSAPLGAFAVAGNTDYPGHWQAIFRDTQVAAEEWGGRHDLGSLVLTTLPLERSYNPYTVVAAEEKLHLVLGHSPNFSLGKVEADLLIAGHTHGGQVRLPGIGPLITLSQVPRSWASGATEIAPGKLLVVSRGIGMERGTAPRLRFLCRPELVFIDIEPSQGT
jgi:predicted MPP superfamily phosphohydrolase